MFISKEIMKNFEWDIFLYCCEMFKKNHNKTKSKNYFFESLKVVCPLKIDF